MLTCIPTDTGQRELVAELRRLLRPGGLLYVSDMCLQDDERNRARYDAFAAEYEVYGVFETEDGAVFRHHEPDWFPSLLTGFDQVATRQVPFETMNGHPARITQTLAQKSPGSS